MTSDKLINIEISYALPDKQRILAIQVPEGTTVFDAAAASGIEKQFPELSVRESSLGIFGKVITKPQQEVIKEGDRIEIYRPLIADPKAARKARAAKNAAK